MASLTMAAVSRTRPDRMNVGKMNILMICSPRSPPESEAVELGANSLHLHLREHDAVQADMDTMYGYCLRREFNTELVQRRGAKEIYQGNVNVVRLLVRNRHLEPTKKKQTLDFPTTYEAEHFTTKQEVRTAVKEFLEDGGDDPNVQNLMIYFTGHGSYCFNELRGRSEEALVLDRGINYTDSELTQDINKYAPDDRQLYLVLDACHSEGMLNLWELEKRTTKPVVLFAGASTEVNAKYDARGGAFTRAFAKFATPGKLLCEIQKDIRQFVVTSPESVHQPNSGPASPAVSYAQPKLSMLHYLIQ